MKLTKTIIKKLIAEAVSKRIQATVDKKNKKLKDDFKSKAVKEQYSLRPEDVERLDGLVLENDIHTLYKVVMNILETLTAEGFETDQVIQYVQQEVEDAGRRYSSIKERELTKKEKTGLTKIHKDVSKKPFIKQYGKEQGEKVYYATTTKMAKKKY